GAFVGGSGWKPVYEILTKDGYNVSAMSPRRSASSTASKAHASWSPTATGAPLSSRLNAIGAADSPKRLAVAVPFAIVDLVLLTDETVQRNGISPTAVV